MSEKEGGGPAFPVPVASMGTPGRLTGMSLRDYFAGQALVGLMGGRTSLPVEDRHFTVIAGLAYQLADVMLKERSK